MKTNNSKEINKSKYYKQIALENTYNRNNKQLTLVNTLKIYHKQLLLEICLK